MKDVKGLTELGGWLEKGAGSSVPSTNAQTLQKKNGLIWKSLSLLLPSTKHQRFTFTAPAYSSCFKAISATGSSVWKSCPDTPD